MDADSITIERIMELALAAYDRGLLRGAQIPAPPHPDPHTAVLLQEIERRWNERSGALHAWIDGEPQLSADEVPGWLLAQQRQTEVQR